MEEEEANCQGAKEHEEEEVMKERRMEEVRPRVRAMGHPPSHPVSPPLRPSKVMALLHHRR